MHIGTDVAPLARGASFPLRHRLLRAAFQLAWVLLARWTPPMWQRWRVLVVNAFGARVHASANIAASARIWFPPNLVMAESACLGPRTICYCMARIEIGAHAVVSQGAHLCAGTHDIDDPAFTLVTQPISIGARAWVASDAFVGPGVVMGEGAVLGARAVSFSSLAPWTVHVGNPARHLRDRARP